MTRYRTIVADPPWEWDKTRGGGTERGSVYRWRDSKASGQRRELDYTTLTLEQITVLPVRDLATPDAHLFVWTTQARLEATYDLVRAWGFSPRCSLVWCKAPHGWGPGGVFQSTVEFCLYGRRGKPQPSKHVVDRQWWEWPRAEHSAKPEAFLDMVEANFPAPRLELFARRARFGWDYYGDQSLGTAEMGAA